MADYRTAMQLTLVVPGLIAIAHERLVASRSLSTFAHWASAPCIERRGIAAALLTALGVDHDMPVAPLALLGAGGNPGDDYILCADPVRLAAERNTVVLAQRIHDLSVSETNALAQTLNRHFAEDDLRFEAIRPDAWFARRKQAAEIDTTPLEVALGRGLLAHLPRGPAAAQWKRWGNEIEMLLHEHPANSAREAAGEPVVSAIWFSGGGRLADA